MTIFHSLDLLGTAAFAVSGGSVTYLFLNSFNVNQDIIHILTTLMVIGVRLIVVKFKLPTFYSKPRDS